MSTLLRVMEFQVYRGPNVYGFDPMIRLQLDLGALEQYPSHQLPGFTDALLALLPTLEAHGCSYREPGGLVRRMREGTWLGPDYPSKRGMSVVKVRQDASDGCSRRSWR